MSQENVEVVRRAYEESYAARSVENTRDYVAEDFRFHMRPEWPGRAIYGREQMTEIWAELDQTYSEFSLVPEEYEQLGGFVLVRLSVSARLRESDARLDQALYHLWEIRDGKAVAAWGYGDREEALEAAGLRE